MTEETYRVVMILLFGVLIGAFIFLGIRFTGTRASSKRSQEKDTNRFQLCLASILALLGAVALPFVFYLTYIFPKTLAVWADSGDEMSAGEAVVAQLSHLCKSFGLLIMPILLLAVIGCVIWAVHAHKRSR
jgi:type II secretory pathway component PulF